MLNTGKITAAISMTLYFEDRAPVEGISFECGPERTIHFRMDKVLVNGVHIPRGVPYAAKLVSDVPVAIQYTRVDTTQSENALMTTIIQ